MKATGKVPVSMRAVLARLNRALAQDGQAIKKCRPGSRAHIELGDYYAIDVSRNYVVAKDVDIEQWAREAGVLQLHEQMVE